MKKSGKPSLLRRFSHIYLEHGAEEYPLAERVLDRFREATIVKVDNYKRVFNRRKQDFQLQKQAAKLILAVKRPPFLYCGSDQCQSHGFRHFYYTTPMLNCPFNCEYCYLQGMYPSSYLVLFVNHAEFLGDAQKFLQQSVTPGDPLYLSISYDTDILPLESTTHYAEDWITLAEEQKDLRVEIRTKSAAYNSLKDLRPTKRVILSWSLSPPSLAKCYEHGAPSFQRRLSSIKKAIADGWSVRLCFDPVLPCAKPERSYGRTISRIFEEISPEDITDVSVGPFRMGKTHFRRIQKMRPDSRLFHSGGRENQDEVLQYMVGSLQELLPKEKVILWTSQS